MDTGRKHGRVRVGSCTDVYTVHTRRERPCTRAVNSRVHGPYTVTWAVYTAVFRSCAAVYTVRRRRERPCTLAVNGRTRYTAVYTAVYPVRVYGPCTRPYITRTRPCTRPVHGVRVLNAAVFTACVHGRSGAVYGPCTRPSTGLVRTVYTAVHMPCTRSVHDPNSAMFAAVCTRPFTACRDHLHGRT